MPFRTLADECDRILGRDELDIDDEPGPANDEDAAVEGSTEAGPTVTAEQRERALPAAAPTPEAAASQRELTLRSPAFIRGPTWG